MSLAKLHTTEKSRKEWRCGSCGDVIPKGSKVIRFTVGYRGRPQERCSKPECFPKPSERESSMVAEVYAAQESVDFGSADSREDIEAMLQDVQDACESVASQYEENPMFESNYDMQERAEQIRSAGDELENWADSLEDEPEENEQDYGAFENEENPYQAAHDAWMEEARSAAHEAVNNMELP